ncbi:aldose 1-epimerase family protein [Marisediminicola antarctica]|uniref:Aldose epimerase n=1 Tax=Marisediminicola antarctica TaxID=674079 RepID=A0A7L5AFA6_9MICO|nr:aldose 1-epimerase family protein [Marisediminicola antarctica]QHO69140.1 aldose epimerase [Marisediminicola antarctica]
MRPPTGEQFALTRTSGNRQSRAIITELAAGLRALSVDGIDLVETYPDASLPPWGSGIVLAPWPNRIRDGVWMLDGSAQQLDLTEVERGNAIHGLLRNTGYRVAERSADSVTLAATVFPQHGYKFQLETTVRYALTDDGITVTHGIHNVGTASAPVAVGAHPYLRLGDVPVDDLALTLPATTHIEVDDRLNPVAVTLVDGTAYDLRAGRRVGDLQLDDGFGGVGAGDTHRLTAPDGRFVELWRDAELAWVQVFTNRKFPRNGEIGLAIAIEPMTAPANAFNSGEGVRWLEPGQSWNLDWGIRYSG